MQLHSCNMMITSKSIIGSAMLLVSTGLIFTPTALSDPDDLIELRNTWNQYLAEVPRRSRSTQCSGLSVMRGTAEAFMSRHSDSSYASKFNALLARYNCPDLAKLEYLPSAGTPDKTIFKPISQYGSCLTMSEILSANKEITKRCENTFIHIKVH